MESIIAVRDRLAALKASWKNCERCLLCESRKSIVFSDGLHNAPIMLIGGGPEELEDARGAPFVGPAGQLLEDMVIKAGGTMSDFYLTNTVMCISSDNRPPNRLEVAACRERLVSQISLVDPVLIIAAGKVAAQAISGSKVAITKRRGEVDDIRIEGADDYYTIPVMYMLHPAAVLRKPSRGRGGLLRDSVKDLKMALAIAKELKRRHA